MGRRTKDTAAGLRFGLPRSTETFPLHGRVRAEFNDHEVRGGHEQLVAQLLLAGERGQVYGLLLGPAADQDLDYVEALLRFELLELEWKVL